MDTNQVGAIDADLLGRVNRPYHFTPFIILLRTLRSEVLKNLQTSEETATDGTDYTDVKKMTRLRQAAAVRRDTILMEESVTIDVR